MPGCPSKIDAFLLPEAAARCGLDEGHPGPHDGTSADPDLSGTLITWVDGDRRVFTGDHPGRCGGTEPAMQPGVGVCVLPRGHHGRHAP